MCCWLRAHSYLYTRRWTLDSLYMSIFLFYSPRLQGCFEAIQNKYVSWTFSTSQNIYLHETAKKILNTSSELSCISSPRCQLRTVVLSVSIFFVGAIVMESGWGKRLNILTCNSPFELMFWCIYILMLTFFASAFIRSTLTQKTLR